MNKRAKERTVFKRMPRFLCVGCSDCMLRTVGRWGLAALATALLLGLRSDGGDDPLGTEGQSSVAVPIAPHNGTAAACAANFAVVIGAGPAGLAVSARLLHAGIPFVLLERSDAAGSSWRSRYDRLHLHTHSEISALPFLPFPSFFPTYVAAHDLADYYAGYARLLGPHLHLRTTVVAVRRVGGRWEVTAEDGRVWSASAVVVATGQEGTPNVPNFEGIEQFPGAVVHSSRYRNGSAYRGARALVVGFGNSGAEIALDLHENGANVTALVRSAVHIIPRWAMNLPLLGIRPYAASRHLPLWVSDAGAALLQRLLYGDLPSLGVRLQGERGLKTELHLHHRAPIIDIGTVELIRRQQLQIKQAEIEAFTDRGVVFSRCPAGATACRRGCEPGSKGCVRPPAEPFDVIVLATGYDKARAPHAAFLPAGLLERSLSAHGQLESGASAAPGLFFAGFTDHSGRLAEIHHESADLAREIGELVPPFDRARRRSELPVAISRQAKAALPQACFTPSNPTTAAAAAAAAAASAAASAAAPTKPPEEDDDEAKQARLKESLLAISQKLAADAMDARRAG